MRAVGWWVALACVACGGEPAGGGEAAPGGGMAGVGGAGGGAGGAGGGAGDGGDGGGGLLGWRSALYPEDWTPGYVSPDGHRIHDFSYAGYHNGAAPIGVPVVNTEHAVDAFGADPTGAADSTLAIQAAIDAASGGGIVVLGQGSYRVDGQLLVASSRVVIRGQGAAQTELFFTQVAGMEFSAHLRFAGSRAYGAEIALAVDAVAHDAVVEVADASGLAVGDDVALGWIITDDFVEEHGMTGVWGPFNGTWQPFFLREVVALDTASAPHRVTLDVPLRYPAKLRDGATLRRESGYLSECGLEGLSVGNAADWDAVWNNDQVHAIAMSDVEDCWMRDVRSFHPPSGPTSGSGADAHLQSGGLLLTGSKRVTIADSRMENAEHRGGGGNGYLFEVRQSNEVLFRDLVARSGRHNFIQNWGFGATGIVWLRVDSAGSESWFDKSGSIKLPAYSELHHSLATANLIDHSRFDDGWSAVNRGTESSGAGHSGTENVIWNIAGAGVVRSLQLGVGYVVGTAPSLELLTDPAYPLGGAGTEPEDWVEGAGIGAGLQPASLYEDQLARRLAN
jgi:hypothetical protein